MTRRIAWLGGALVALGTSAVVVAQDMKREKPLIAPGVDRKVQCENALLSKEYLKGCSITVRDEAGKICCEGQVPSKVHACAVFLTCMSVEGVTQVDLSKLCIGETGTGSTSGAIPRQDLNKPGDVHKPQPNPLTPGTDVKGGLAKDGEKGADLKHGVAAGPGSTTTIGSSKLRMYAVVISGDAHGTTTEPAGAKRSQNDVIVIEDSGSTLGSTNLDQGGAITPKREGLGDQQGQPGQPQQQQQRGQDQQNKDFNQKNATPR